MKWELVVSDQRERLLRPLFRPESGKVDWHEGVANGRLHIRKPPQTEQIQESSLEAVSEQYSEEHEI